MDLGIYIAIKVLWAAYVGVGVWLTMRVMTRAGYPWWWAVAVWTPGFLGVIPRLEFLGVLAAPVPLILLWIFAYAEWPNFLDTEQISKRSRGLTQSEREIADAVAATGGATQLLGGDDSPETLQSGPANVLSPAAWLMTGFDESGRTVRLEITDSELASGEEGVIIGRHPQMAQRVISDDSVSRRHCRIQTKGKRLVIEDLNSANGTIVNGERLVANRAFALERGAVVELGAVKLTVSRS